MYADFHLVVKGDKCTSKYVQTLRSSKEHAWGSSPGLASFELIYRSIIRTCVSQNGWVGDRGTQKSMARTQANYNKLCHFENSARKCKGVAWDSV